MTTKINIASAQLNFIVGDLVTNKHKIIKAHNEASLNDVDLLVFSEMAITGYPPEDLVLRKSFQEEARQTLEEIAKITANGTAILVGNLTATTNDTIYNSAYLLDKGEIVDFIHKKDLPNYGVFDEKRIFIADNNFKTINFRDINLGILICEDLWNIQNVKKLKQNGAEILISINASPFESDKLQTRIQLAQNSCIAVKLPIIYVNQVGGQDELVFDGGSFILDEKGTLYSKQSQWQESIITTRWHLKNRKWLCQEAIIEKQNDHLTNIYEALKLSLKDYVVKNNFPAVVIGMSGGIDSALTAAVAVDALGSDKVKLIMMPSKYTSSHSIEDAQECANLLNVKLEIINIEPVINGFDELLSDVFKGYPIDTTEENIQSRIRGNILMAVSNKFGHMVLTTGNKSEMAVGYATLYGDMCGGYNILKDIYKTDVFKIAKWRNNIKYVIPVNIIEKPPSAELRHDQKDEDSLPPYSILDEILISLIEKRQSTNDIVNKGYPKDIVEKIAKLVKISEYKRRQAPAGVKISRLAFGKDRRYPITNKYNF